MSWDDGVRQGLASVQQRIDVACRNAGRSPNEVTLVAVSKTQPAEAIRAAYAAGQRQFGENYVQELVHKARALEDLPELRWRLVGHLQRNKAKDVLRVAASVDTVDSERLVHGLARRARDAGCRADVLVQVNVAGEAQKSGCSVDEVDAIVAAAKAEPELELHGLMTVAPYSDDPETARPVFRRLRELAARHRLPELSMGMSGDLEVAIEEGATRVRVGTAIFGARERG
jgi:hypothetical protein